MLKAFNEADHIFTIVELFLSTQIGVHFCILDVLVSHCWKKWII